LIVFRQPQRLIDQDYEYQAIVAIAVKEQTMTRWRERRLLTQRVRVQQLKTPML